MNELVLVLIVAHFMFLYWAVVEYKRVAQQREYFVREIIAYVCSSPPIYINGKTQYVAAHSIEVGWALLSSGVRIAYCLTDKPRPVTQRQLSRGEVVAANYPVFGGGFSTCEGSIEESKKSFAEATRVRVRVAAEECLLDEQIAKALEKYKEKK